MNQFHHYDKPPRRGGKPVWWNWYR